MTYPNKIRTIALFNHIISLYGIYYIIYSYQYHWLLIGIISWTFVMIFSCNISLHRFISHNSFKTTKTKEKFLKYISIISGFGSPLSYCSMHRYHHLKSGSKDDNQSPKNIGYLRAWLTIYDNIKIPPSLIRDIIKDKDYLFIHKNYFKILLIYVSLLYLIDPLIGIFIFSFPAMLCYQAAGAFAVIPHSKKFGYTVVKNKNEDDSVNSPLASFLSLGEGWHNYHHTFPSDYRHGHHIFEFDPPAFIIEKIFKNDTK